MANFSLPVKGGLEQPPMPPVYRSHTQRLGSDFGRLLRGNIKTTLQHIVSVCKVVFQVVS